MNRPSINEINSDQLDALYDRLEDDEKVIAHLEDGERLRQRAEAALARVRTYAQNAIDAGDTGPGVGLGRLLLRLLDQPEER